MSERYLANENFPAEIARFLRACGDDVVHIADALAGAADERVLQMAVAEDRVVLTFDRDFGELVFRRRDPPAPGIVLFRVTQQPPEIMLGFLRSFFESQPTLRGFFTVAGLGRFRQVSLAKEKGTS